MQLQHCTYQRKTCKREILGHSSPLKGLQRDSTHRKIWKTKKRLIEAEGYDKDESIDAAVNQRKFLLQRMLTYADVMDNNNTDTDIDHE